MSERVRSPRYPAISLSEAEELARKIYKNDSTNAVDREVAVQHMGYSSLNGASATILASLNQYGLTSGAGKGMVKLSEVALDIVEPQSEESRRAALVMAAKTPELFASLEGTFPGPVSEAALRAHLVRQGFKPAALRQVLPAFLETREYVADFRESESHRHDGSAAIGSVATQPVADPVMTKAVELTPAPREAPPPARTPAGINETRLEVDGSVGAVQARFNKRGLSKLIKKLQAVEAILDEDEDEVNEYRDRLKQIDYDDAQADLGDEVKDVI